MPYVPNPEADRRNRERVAANIEADSKAMQGAFDKEGIAGTTAYLEETRGAAPLGRSIAEVPLIERGVQHVRNIFHRNRK